MKYLLLLSIFLCLSLTYASLLTTLESEIKTKKSLQKYMFPAPSTVFDYLESLAEKSGHARSVFPLSSISTQIITQNGIEELIVTASATIWDNTPATTQLIFYLTSKDVFEFYGTFSLTFPTLPSNLTKNTGEKYYGGIKLTGKNTISVASASFTDLKGHKYKKGLTLETHFSLLTSSPLYPTVKSTTGVSTLNGEFDAFFPLQAGDPVATFTLSFDDPIHFDSNHITASNLKIVLVAEKDPEITATSVLVFELAHSTMLSFDVSADVVIPQSLKWSGVLKTEWVDVFGLKWLSFEPGFKILFSTPATTLEFVGEAVLTFASGKKPVHVEWDVVVNNELETLFLLQFPLSDFTTMYSDTVGKQPLYSDEFHTSGDVTMALSTFTSTYKGYEQGITVTGEAIVSGTGKFAKTLHSFNVTHLDFPFKLYIPVFTNAMEMTFDIQETNPLEFRKNIVLTHAEFDFTLEPLQATLDGDLSVTLKKNPTPLTFDVSGVISDTSTTFDGHLTDTWTNPFGIHWMYISKLDVNMVFADFELQGITFTGTADITVGDLTSATVTIKVGPDFSGVSFQLSASLNFQKFFKATLDKDSPQVLDSAQLVATMTISTYAHDAYQEGLTVDGYLVVQPGTKLGGFLKAIDPQGSLLYSFKTHFYIPIFGSGNPAQFSVEFTETGAVHMTKDITLNSLDIALTILPSPSITFNAQSTITLKHNEVLSTTISGNLDETELSLTGDVNGNWKNAFGMHWLTLQDLSLTITISEAGLQALSVACTANVTFSKGFTDFTASLSLEDNFEEWSLSIQDVAVVSLSDAVKEIGFKTPSTVDDTTTVKNTIDLSLDSSSGLTLSESVTISGELLKKLKIFHTGLASETFTMALSLPVFSPGVVSFSLSLPALRVNKRMIWTGVVFSIDSMADISLATGVKVNFTKNPELEFDVHGSLNADGAVTLGGDMLGTWDNMFGIKGFDLSHVEIAISFDPSMCDVDACLSGLGLGYTITIDDDTYKLYGYASIPDLANIFIELAVDNPTGIILSFRNMAVQYNKMAGKLLPHIDVNDIPSSWGLKDFLFYLAPVAGTFNDIHYQAGFMIDGGFDVFGIDVTINITVTSDDFAFDVSINKDTFQHALNDELLAMGYSSPSDLVHVHDVVYTGLHTKGVAGKDYGHFKMYYAFLGDREVSFDVSELADCWGTFHDFFVKYLKHLF